MKIAIVGSGIAGMGAAYILNRHYDITLFEKESYIGGHSRTVDVDTDDEGRIGVDTGFIVLNYRNYPNLTGLFKKLGVHLTESNMSFGVSIRDRNIEYGTQRVRDIFAQKKNFFNPAYIKMVLDILKFNKKAGLYLQKNRKKTLGECLEDMNMSKWFIDYYLLAMGASIWSTDPKKMKEFPAEAFIRFFENHGLLTVNEQPQWYTVTGGSREYVKKLTEPYRDKIRLNSGIASVKRNADSVSVTDVNGNTEEFDRVVFASHPDQTLEMLENPSEEEKNILGFFQYQPNNTVVHSDTDFMPRKRNAWSSWIYMTEAKSDDNDPVKFSYWMNNLQPLGTKMPIIETLNPGNSDVKGPIHDRFVFHHPVFDQKAIDGQDKVAGIQGKDRIYFCGAWLRNGFHEDGLWSAVQLAESMGCQIPWTTCDESDQPK